ncbi:MAG TPA: isochorismatase family cysteine hydrolase [Steroidobacter sp.]|uniref:cysteine hydrolase family protein n=1 Tax=Steroidobacter sp. TaxID=1978227 RepID=UPI002ED83663
MPRKQRQPRTALLILDMLSQFRYPDGERIVRGARKAAANIARLRERAHTAGIPVIYVNDTAGKWESDQKSFVRRCMEPASRGRDIAQLLAPGPKDYFMFKPRHSAFFGTPLHTLLDRLHVRRLIATGITSHQCVLFTAMDAHVREFELVIPPDCIGAGAAADTKHALYIFSQALMAKTASSRQLRF